jgi:hypothetical protein
MKKDKKQQQQVFALAAVVVIIVGVIVGFYWRKLLPAPVSDGLNVPTPSGPRLQLVGNGDYKPLLDRQDFRALEAFGDVPVKVLQHAGNPKPFASEAEAAGQTER